MVLDLFPTRLGMASSLQAFFAGLSDAATAGIVAPAAMGSVEGLAAVSAVPGFIGLLSWTIFRRGMSRGGRHESGNLVQDHPEPRPIFAKVPTRKKVP